MALHPIEQAVKDFLSASAEGKAPFNPQFLDECLDNVKKSLMDSFHKAPDKEFRLRMSNIGRDLRQLGLEKLYGRKAPKGNFLLKMLTGSIQEHTLIYILKSQGLEIETSGEVSLPVGETSIDGTWDLKLKLDGKIYDVKTASDFSYKFKFKSYESLNKDDSFGYVDQLLGYCEAAQCEAGGWVVINKTTGDVKVVPFPIPMEKVRVSFLSRLAKKISDVAMGKLPPCKGVVPETFNRKLTGNRILDFKCEWCNHKEICHPTVTYEPQRASIAKEPPMKYYVN